jgi:hypothetical protein
VRPLKEILDELVDAARTASAAGESDEGVLAAIARDYEVLGPDEQERVRIELSVPEGGTALDVAMNVLSFSPSAPGDGGTDTPG